MKIAIAGTGFASILCINYLVELGIKPIVFDLGNELDNEDKILLKKKALSKQKDLDKFHSIGGLSNVWTGVVSKYLEEDFNDWPIGKNEFENYYSEVLKFFSHSNRYTFSSNSNNDLLNYYLNNHNDQNKSIIYNKKSISLKYISLLLKNLGTSNNKINDYQKVNPFNFKFIVKDLIKGSKIDYRKEKIIKISENENLVKIISKNEFNVKTELDCDYLFLGCGSISTYLIIKNSVNNFDQNIKIKTTKQIVTPVKFKKIEKFSDRFFNPYPVFQINLKESSDYSIYTQISNLNPTIVNYFFPKITNFKRYFFLLNFFKNYGLSYSNLGHKFCDEFTVDNKNNIHIYENKIKTFDFLNIYSEVFEKNVFDNYFCLYKIPFKMKPLSGNHFGSVFPMNLNKKNFFNSDRFGRICNFKKISITDSSIFSKLSARPPSLTIMANSLRIATEVHKLNFFK